MFGLSKKNPEFCSLGEERFEIPRLTIEKWELLFDSIGTLPQMIINVLQAQNRADFAATMVVAVQMSLDEISALVAALTGRDKDWIKKNADHRELFDFLSKTVKKNDLVAEAKKYRSAFAGWMTRKSDVDDQ